MKFSVIIPAHNEQETIAKALSSIRQQTFKDYELIVVCDSCTDNTKAIAESYEAKVIEIDAHSSGMARNVGLDGAQGDWILFCDADDWYLHEYAFEILAERVGRADEDVLIFALIWKHYGYGPTRSPKGTIFPHVANKCWRRSSIGNTRFPGGNGVVGEDAVFWDKMTDKGIRISEWDMPLYYYNYLRPGSKSVKQGRNATQTKNYWKNN